MDREMIHLCPAGPSPPQDPGFGRDITASDVPFLMTDLLGMEAKLPTQLLGAPSHGAEVTIPVLTHGHHLGCAVLGAPCPCKLLLQLGTLYPEQMCSAWLAAAMLRR